MESVTDILRSLSYLIEALSALMALSGVVIIYKGHRLAGSLVAFGAGLHFLGYAVMMFQTQVTALNSFLSSLMFPGFLLLTAGLCYLAFTLQSPIQDA